MGFWDKIISGNSTMRPMDVFYDPDIEEHMNTNNIVQQLIQYSLQHIKTNQAVGSMPYHPSALSNRSIKNTILMAATLQMRNICIGLCKEPKVMFPNFPIIADLIKSGIIPQTENDWLSFVGYLVVNNQKLCAVSSDLSTYYEA